MPTVRTLRARALYIIPRSYCPRKALARRRKVDSLEDKTDRRVLNDTNSIRAFTAAYLLCKRASL